MAFLKTLSWRDALVVALVTAVAVVGVRAERSRDAATQDNRRGATLVAVAVCQQSNVLVASSMAKKTPAQRRAIRPLVEQYLRPLDKALEALGQAPCEKP